jgi:uncharacterized SAM-binding protein YcdF (DUF218 family)
LKPKHKAGKILVTIGTGLLLLLSIAPVSGALLRTLEQRYPPLNLSSLPVELTKSPSGIFIVVLGSGYSPDPSVDRNSHLSQDALARLLEGVQICQEVESCRLILSGGPTAAAQAMKEVSLSLGVPQREIILEENSRNTEQEARLIKPMVGIAPFILVTSASHMPRAMGLFQKLGMHPIAAPTDYLAKTGGPFSPDEFYPGAGGLSEAERAVYEYLGMAWEKLRGQI